jgi:hypothetical protein
MQVLPHENDADDRDRGRGRNHGTRMNMKKANAARTPIRNLSIRLART